MKKKVFTICAVWRFLGTCPQVLHEIVCLFYIIKTQSPDLCHFKEIITSSIRHLCSQLIVELSCFDFIIRHKSVEGLCHKMSVYIKNYSTYVTQE